MGFEAGTTGFGYDKLTKYINGKLFEAVFDKDHNGLNFFVTDDAGKVIAKRYNNSTKAYNMIAKMF